MHILLQVHASDMKSRTLEPLSHRFQIMSKLKKVNVQDLLHLFKTQLLMNQ